jgi:hypothetical protein
MLKKSVISNLILTENFLSFYTIVSFVLLYSLVEEEEIYDTFLDYFEKEL